MKSRIAVKIFIITMLVLLVSTSVACLHDKKKEKENDSTTSTQDTNSADGKKDTSIGEKKIITEDDLKDKGKNDKDKKDKSKKSKEKDGKQFGYIKKVHTEDGRKFLIIDYAQMLTGEEAKKAAQSAGEEINNDYYIVNQNKKLRTIDLSLNVVVVMKTWQMTNTGKIEDQSLNIAKFTDIFSSTDEESERLAANPYWITIKDGVITKIEEQYLP